jgi:hypothetical protein
VVFDIIVTVLLPTLFVVVLSIFLGRRRPGSSGDTDADSLSFAGGVISALFTVVLAFYIVFAWQLGADIESASGAEAEALIDAHWQAEVLPAPPRAELQSLLRDYAVAVVDDEWELLSAGETDEQASEIIRELRTGFAAVPVDGGGVAVEVAREQALRDVRQIDESHRARVDLATSSDVFNNVLLAGTVVGAALMIAFPLMVGLSARPVNVAVMTILTLVVSGIVYIAIQLTHPLAGPFGVEPDAFLEALHEMRPGA